MEVFVQLLIFSLFFCSRASAQDANASCSSSEYGSIRLYNTVTDVEGEGAVQICYYGTWYAVCDYAWGCADANVACRELGYSAGASATVYDADNYFGSWPNIRNYYYSCNGYEASLSSCYTHYASYYHCYYYSDTAGVRCSAPDNDNPDTCSPDGAVRLVDGTKKEGRLEYCYNGHWSSICQRYNFDDEEATVACKQLGYAPFGSIVYDSEYSCSDGDCDNGLINYISCSLYATESELQSCSIHPRSSNSYQCSSCAYPVAIRCYEYDNCTDGTVQLVNGTIDQEGRVEVCVNGVWGSICNHGWDRGDAFVVCRQLGYANTVPDISRYDVYGSGDNPIVYSYMSCEGFETSITDCSKSEYLHYYSCYSSSSAGVLCTDGCVENALRLVGGQTELEGTVEVCVNNMWGLIGDGGWDDADADVVCRQLGLPTGGATAVPNSEKTNRVTVHYSYVLCKGDEPLLEKCQKVSLTLDEGNAAYDEATVAGIICAEATGPPRYPDCLPKEPPTGPSECTSGNVRMMDDQETLQYCHNGHWTGLCTMTHHEAMVACNTLGHTHYTWGLIYDNYQNIDPAVTYNSSFKNISCSGRETKLKKCKVHEGKCLTQCPKPIGLKCFEPTGCSEGAVRLNGGSIEQEGRVEVCINGVWGSICDYGWDKTDAHVACQQLGYNELEPVAYTGSTFGEAMGPMVYSHVSCEGWEKNLEKCKKLQYENFTCPHYTVAGVMCSNGCTPGKVRLVNGRKANEGTVEICLDYLWGLISDVQWSDSDAEVVCRQLGYSITSGSKAFTGSHYGKPNMTIHAGNVRCEGDEENLEQCSMTTYSLEEGKHIREDVAGVSCVSLPSASPTAAASSDNSTSPLLVAILVIVCIVFIIVTICIIAFIIFIVSNRRQKAGSGTGGGSRNLPSIVMSKTLDDDEDDNDDEDRLLLKYSGEEDSEKHDNADDELLT